MEYFKIQVDRNQFKQSYLIYIIEVVHDVLGTYYYVGQTGDRNHHTARPAFRRLGAHFSDQGHSTENQLYRAIVKKILKVEDYEKGKFENSVKYAVTEFLMPSTISMHAFPIREFSINSSTEDHSLNRKHVEDLENSIIFKMRQRFTEERILNKKSAKDLPLSQEASDTVFSIIQTVCP